MYTRILVPLDGSDLAEKALARAQGLASAFGSSIHLLQVVSRRAEMEAGRWAGMTSPQAAEYSVDMARRAIEAEIARGREYVEGIATQLTGAGITAQAAIREGAADEKIIEYAKEQEIDLIVMSTHGYGGLRRFLLGSVTDRVVRSSDVPVLVLPA